MWLLRAVIIFQKATESCHKHSFVEITMETKKYMHICISYLFSKFIPNGIKKKNILVFPSFNNLNNKEPKIKVNNMRKISWYKRWPHYCAKIFFCSFDDAHFFQWVNHSTIGRIISEREFLFSYRDLFSILLPLHYDLFCL